MPSRVRVAIAHDYLTQRGGAERVVLALSRAFPDAPIYTTLYNSEATYPEFQERQVITSPLNRMAKLRQDHRWALPLLAPTSSGLHVPADVTIASSSGWAHGFRAAGKLLVYCHNPARWLYQKDEYLGDAGLLSAQRLAVTALGPALRRWDRSAAKRADRYLANSSVVRERIQISYGVDARVLMPPPGLTTEGEATAPASLEEWGAGGFWLVVSRLLPYKNVGKAIKAFSETQQRLVVVGAGPEKERLLSMAPANVRIVSDVPDAELRWIYEHARGLVAPSREDFGLTPLEANARGLPIVALRAGGYLDTVVDGETGLFFTAKEGAAGIRQRVAEAEERTWDVEALQAHAESFGEANFIAHIHDEVERLLQG